MDSVCAWWSVRGPAWDPCLYHVQVYEQQGLSFPGASGRALKGQRDSGALKTQVHLRHSNRGIVFTHPGLVGANQICLNCLKVVEGLVEGSGADVEADWARPWSFSARLSLRW